MGRNFISLAGLGVSLHLDQRRKQPDHFSIPLFAKNGKRKKKRKINLFSISLNGKRCNLAIQGNSVSSSEEHRWPGYYSQIQEITALGSEMYPFLELVVFLSYVLDPLSFPSC